MNEREKTIRLWFDMWLNQQDMGIDDIFAEDVIYTESWSPQYNNRKTVKHWFQEWNTRGRVVVWEIKQFFHKGDQTIVEWYFKNEMNNGSIEEFDGISLVEWTEDNKIKALKEFGCNRNTYNSVSYYLYAVPEKPIEALSLSDYNHLREILGLSPVVMGNNEFLVHCDTWNYMDGIRQGLKQQPEITLNGRTLTIAETPILTEPMEQYQMAGTKGYVLVLPDEAASQLVGEKIRLAMKLEDGGYPELKSDLKQFLNSGKWQPELQSGQQLPEKVTLGVTVKAWGVANSLTGFTAISFCGLYLSIIFIILSCSVLAFEQLSAIDKNQKNYAVIDRLGVPGHRQASLIRRELSTVFLIPLLFPLLLTVLLITGAQFFFGEAILQQGLVPLYGLVTILLFCAIYLT